MAKKKKRFPYECSRFKFNNLGLALGTNMKLYTSVAKGLKVKTFWGLIPTVVEVAGENLIAWAFCPTSHIHILNRVNKNLVMYTEDFVL